MDQLFGAAKPFLDALGVEPWMYPVLLAFGVGHQYAKGTIERWTQSWSLMSAGAVAIGFGILSAVEAHLPPLEAATRTLVLFAAAAITEKLAEKLADVLPFIPKNNAWAKKADAPSA